MNPLKEIDYIIVSIWRFAARCKKGEGGKRGKGKIIKVLLFCSFPFSPFPLFPPYTSIYCKRLNNYTTSNPKQEANVWQNMEILRIDTQKATPMLPISPEKLSDEYRKCKNRNLMTKTQGSHPTSKSPRPKTQNQTWKYRESAPKKMSLIPPISPKIA
jgi:hypothetical protein